jgi:sialic acid synthase SpsE
MIKKFKIGKIDFNRKNKAVFIAEAAVEHLGSLNVAKQMALTAKRSGADIIKFQMHIPESEMLKNKIKFWGGSLDQILDNYNLTINDHKELIKYCKKINIQYLCTPFCPEAVKVLNKLGVKGFKTGSGEMLNLPLIDQIIKTRKPLILSTGMSTLKEVEFIVGYLKKNKANFMIMNCTSIYPCPPKFVNLNLINLYKAKFNILVGHSDHTSDIWTSLGAVANGAQAIEKHFTLNRNLEGPDFEVSLEPKEFKMMVEGARVIKLALGNTKKIHQKEVAVRNWAHHSIVAKQDIKKFQKLTENNLTVKRPGGGIPAHEFYSVVGKKVNKKILKNSQIIKKNLLK